jgi:hypothetical protein
MPTVACPRRSLTIWGCTFSRSTRWWCRTVCAARPPGHPDDHSSPDRAPVLSVFCPCPGGNRCPKRHSRGSGNACNRQPRQAVAHRAIMPRDHSLPGLRRTASQAAPVRPRSPALEVGLSRQKASSLDTWSFESKPNARRVIGRRAVSVAERAFTHRRAVDGWCRGAGRSRVVLAALRWRDRHRPKSDVGSGSIAPRLVREFRKSVRRGGLAHGFARVRGRPLSVDVLLADLTEL